MHLPPVEESQEQAVETTGPATAAYTPEADYYIEALLDDAYLAPRSISGVDMQQSGYNTCPDVDEFQWNVIPTAIRQIEYDRDLVEDTYAPGVKALDELFEGEYAYELSVDVELIVGTGDCLSVLSVGTASTKLFYLLTETLSYSGDGEAVFRPAAGQTVHITNDELRPKVDQTVYFDHLLADAQYLERAAGDPLPDGDPEVSAAERLSAYAGIFTHPLFEDDEQFYLTSRYIGARDVTPGPRQVIVGASGTDLAMLATWDARGNVTVESMPVDFYDGPNSYVAYEEDFLEWVASREPYSDSYTITLPTH